jgi:sulfate transport system permease protein
MPLATASGKKRQHSFGERVLILLALLYAAALICAPLAAIFWGSLVKGIGEFLTELTSASALSALRLTILLSTGATIINTLFGTCVAMVLARDRFRGRRLVNGLVDLPFAVSPVIAGFMLILLFGRNGWLTSVSDLLGLKVVFAWPGMLIVTTFVSLPFVIRELVPVLEQIGQEQEKAAYTMGATPWQAFWYITLPNIRWGLMYGISLTFARTIGEFGAVLVVSGGVSKLTESSTLFIFRSLDDRNYVGAYAMALTLVIISLTVLTLMEFFKKRVHPSE